MNLPSMVNLNVGIDSNVKNIQNLNFKPSYFQNVSQLQNNIQNNNFNYVQHKDISNFKHNFNIFLKIYIIKQIIIKI